MKKSLGPFSGGQLTTIICVVVVMVLFPVGAWAVAGSNAFVTDAVTGKHATVDAGGNLRIAAANPNAIPSNQFSIPPQPVGPAFSGSPALQPDPSGTRYAISSIVVTNPLATPITVGVEAVSALSFANGCKDFANSVKAAGGPEVVVAAKSTVSLAFPQPFVLGTTGARECFGAFGIVDPGPTWSAVGRKI